MDEVELIIAEGKALNNAMGAIEGKVPLKVAREEVKQFLENYPEADTIERFIIREALQNISQDKRLPPTYVTSATTEDERLFLAIGTAWVSWLLGTPVDERTLPEDISLEDEAFLNGMALQQWLHAVRNLIAGKKDSAEVFYRRAMTLGSEYGVASNPAIHWSFVATYFPTSSE